MARVLLILFFSLPLLAGAEISVAPDLPEIGKKAKLSIGTDSEISLQEGMIYAAEKPDIPLCSITGVMLKDGILTADLIFYQSGELEIPLDLKKADGKTERIIWKVSVKGIVAEDEKLNDIESPLVFSGDYIFRVVVIMFLIIAAGFGIYYFYLLWKKKRPLDAVVETYIAPDDGLEKYLEEILSVDEISEKLFFFTITAWVKKKLSFKTGRNLQSMTDYQMQKVISRELKLDLKQLEAEGFSIVKKYAAGDSMINTAQAREIMEFWRKQLEL